MAVSQGAKYLNYNFPSGPASPHISDGPRETLLCLMRGYSVAQRQAAIDYIICLFSKTDASGSEFTRIVDESIAQATYEDSHSRVWSDGMFRPRFGRTRNEHTVIYAWSWDMTKHFPFERDLELVDTVIHELMHQDAQRFAAGVRDAEPSEDEEAEADQAGRDAGYALRASNLDPRFIRAGQQCASCQ